MRTIPRLELTYICSPQTQPSSTPTILLSVGAACESRCESTRLDTRFPEGLTKEATASGVVWCGVRSLHDHHHQIIWLAGLHSTPRAALLVLFAQLGPSLFRNMRVRPCDKTNSATTTRSRLSMDRCGTRGTYSWNPSLKTNQVESSRVKGLDPDASLPQSGLSPQLAHPPVFN